MKKSVFFVSLLLILFVSCPVPSPDPEPSLDPQPTSVTEAEASKEAFVLFRNDGQFAVDLYSDALRMHYIASISSGGTYTMQAAPSVGGSVWYLVHHVDVGVDIPWYNNESYTAANPVAGTTVTVPITDPASMQHTSCWIVLENNNLLQKIILRLLF